MPRDNLGLKPQLIYKYRLIAALVAVIAIVAGDRLMSLSTQPELPRYSFAVTIGGSVLGAFREVSGLDVELEVVEYRDGSGGATRKVPGATKYSNIVLKRGFSGDTQLYDWFTEFSQSREARVDGSITMLDQTQQEVARWNFVHAWPSKVSGPTLSARSNEVPVESIELVHEGLSLVVPGRR